MFKTLLRTAAAAAAVLLSGVAVAATTLSINTALTPADPLFKGLEVFRDAVTKRTNGAIEVKLFPEFAARLRRGRAGAGPCRRARCRGGRWRPPRQFRQGVRRARRALSGLGLRRHPQGGDVGHVRGMGGQAEQGFRSSGPVLQLVAGRAAPVDRQARTNARRPQGQSHAHDRLPGLALDHQRDGRYRDADALCRGLFGTRAEGDRFGRGAVARPASTRSSSRSRST